MDISKLQHTSSGEQYYKQPRLDLANMVPENCQNILELGCGYGSLGQILKSTRKCEIDGVELNTLAEPHLQKIYSAYWIGDLEKIDTSEFKNNYDCIIFPDVLEHLQDPWLTLGRFSSLLSAEGVVVASIPNIRNLAILYRLIIQGRWLYEESGILDRGHLRFFTRHEIEQLFSKCNLKIESIEVNRDNYSGLKAIVACLFKIFINDIDVCQFRIMAREIKHA